MGSMRLPSAQHRRPVLRASLLALAVFTVDQLSKKAVNGSLLPGAHQHLLKGLDLVNVHNHQFLLGFIPVGTVLRTVFGAVGLLLAFVFCARYLRLHSTPSPIWLPIGLMLGGGAGNLADLLVRRSATDFIELTSSHIAFNLADASVTLSLLTLLYVRARAHVKALRMISGPSRNAQAL